MTTQNYSNLIIEKVNDKQKMLADDSDQRIFNIANLKQPNLTSKNKSVTQYAVWIALVVASIIILYITFIRNYPLNHMIISLEERLKQMYERSPPRAYLIVFLIINTVLICCVGSHSVFCVITALVIKNQLGVYLILIIASVCGDAITYIIAKKWLRSKLVQKFYNNEFFGILLEESKNEPFKTAFLTRLLFIPAGIKNYILCAIDNKAVSYFLSGIVLHSLYIIESILVAQELSEIEELLNKSHQWGEKSTIEKISFIFVICFVIFTIAFVLLLGAWAKKKINSRKQRSIELDLKIG